MGSTLIESLRSAPFPHPSRGYTDDRVLVFLPEGYRVTDQVDVLVHFHGHATDIQSTDPQHGYREQLWLARKNAVLVLPQGPVRARDSGIGKLEDPGGLKAMLDDVLAVLEREGAAPAGSQVRFLALSGHSGGYRAIARGLQHGGSPVHEVYLHDGLYGERAAFQDWAVGGPGRKLVSTYQGSGSTATNNAAMARTLRDAGLDVREVLTDAALTAADALIVKLDAGHNQVVRERRNLVTFLRRSGLADLDAPVPELRVVRAIQGQVEVRWTRLGSATVRGSRLYGSSDGAAPWTLLLDETQLGPDAHSARLPAGAPPFLQLRAVSDLGEESSPSDVYGSGASAQPVLVVDGFHRSRGSSQSTYRHALGALHGRAIAAAGRGFDCASARAVVEGDVLLSDYDVVDWFVGDQSSEDGSLSSAEQASLARYLEGGGTLVVSGSEVAYDLSRGTAADRAFLSSVLRCRLGGDRAASAAVTGEGLLQGLSVTFGGAGAAYPEDFPDYLVPESGASAALRYGDGNLAGVSFEGSFGASSQRSGLFFLGLPLETIDGEPDRAAVTRRLLDALDAVNARAGR
jgi:hypothetical protein